MATERSFANMNSPKAAVKSPGQSAWIKLGQQIESERSAKDLNKKAFDVNADMAPKASFGAAPKKKGF